MGRVSLSTTIMLLCIHETEYASDVQLSTIDTHVLLYIIECIIGHASHFEAYTLTRVHVCT